MTFEVAIEHLRQLKVVSLNEQPEECALMYGEALNAIEELYQRYEKVRIERDTLLLGIKCAYQGQCKECPIGIEVHQFVSEIVNPNVVYKPYTEGGERKKPI